MSIVKGWARRLRVPQKDELRSGVRKKEHSKHQAIQKLSDARLRVSFRQMLRSGNPEDEEDFEAVALELQSRGLWGIELADGLWREAEKCWFF
ncbi:MAG: hypothetical protein IJ184_05490 [Alphaproteobacteria bacterium]|nr:hypothetical protein [Alphaproteobacteria bacterium]